MRKLRGIRDYAYVLPRLGIDNVLAVIRHRRQCQDGTFVRLLPVRSIAHPRPLWEGDATPQPVLAASPVLLAAILKEGDAIVAGIFRRFGRELVHEGEYPVWCKGVYGESSQAHFSDVPINTVRGEDVKLSWDLSRFHWAPKLALAAAASAGEARARYLARLHQLTTHWLGENGFERGVNWSCAHEVSIRGIQLMVTTQLLETQLSMQPSAQLVELLHESWKRVEAVHAYGKAQQNNHGLTEHLFLIYCAAFLARHGVTVADGTTLTKLHKQLPWLMGELILPDGGTAMYSLNYHRVFCDIIAFAKLFDDAYGLQLLAQPKLQQHVARLAGFLAAVIEPRTGKLPWIGNHDGSMHCVQYSDIADAEPTLLFLSALFDLPVTELARRAMDHGWLFGYSPRFAPETTVAEQWFDAFGLAIIDRSRYRAYVKYPRHRFRPAQEDFLHLDLWIDGVNVLSDGGNYSYNAATPNGQDGLSDAMAHNVPTLLNRPLLRKLTSFLYAYWPNATLYRKDRDAPRISVALPGGMTLHRTLRLEEQRIILQDQVTGSEAWGVVFHGRIAETMIDRKHTVSFANLKHISSTLTDQADNYYSSISTKQLIAVPLDANMPLTTTIILSEA